MNTDSRLEASINSIKATINSHNMDIGADEDNKHAEIRNILTRVPETERLCQIGHSLCRRRGKYKSVSSIVNAAGRYFHGMIAFHIPNYPQQAEVMSASEMKNLLFDESKH